MKHCVPIADGIDAYARRVIFGKRSMPLKSVDEGEVGDDKGGDGGFVGVVVAV